MRLIHATSGISLAAALLLFGGCGGGEQSSGGPDDPSAATDLNGGQLMGTLTISTDAFEPDGPIPSKYTGEAEDVSPALQFSGVPDGTKSLVIICDDPDAPRPEPWVHWIIFDIPADSESLPEGVPRDAELESPAGAKQGINSWPSDNVGYRGPMPPPGGVHHYHFKLYALDTTLDVSPAEADKDTLLAAMKGHVLDKAEVVGTYERKR
jgi:Raf kinase inhibitor-like YbhB/YbcL family protein